MLKFLWSNRVPIEQHWAKFMVLFGDCFVPRNRPNRVADQFLSSVIPSDNQHAAGSDTALS